MARGQYTPIHLTCEHCGNPFIRRRSRVGRYCSRQCRAQSSDRVATFWSYAAWIDGCLVWQKSKNPKGYGWWNWCKRPIMAHLFAYELAHGAVPEGKQVCHTCDNPSCINPAHLFAGTPKENTADMMSKDRHAHGDRTPIAKLSDAQARIILARLAAGEPRSALAREYGVSRSTIGRLAIGQTWQHLHRPEVAA